MFKWVYRVKDGQFVQGGPFEPRYDPATEAVVVLREHPNVRLERYDGASETKTRAATPEEIAAHDDSREDARAQAEINGDRRLLALAEYFRIQINIVRARLVPPLAPLDKDEIIDFVKGSLRKSR